MPLVKRSLSRSLHPGLITRWKFSTLNCLSTLLLLRWLCTITANAFDRLAVWHFYANNRPHFWQLFFRFTVKQQQITHYWSPIFSRLCHYARTPTVSRIAFVLVGTEFHYASLLCTHTFSLFVAPRPDLLRSNLMNRTLIQKNALLW